MKKAASILLVVCVLACATGWIHGSIEEELVEELVEELLEEEVEIVPYQTTFKQYAPDVDWDWQLLAAVAYHESRFNNRAQSPSGACGVMQMMPTTAERFGLNDSTIWVPEENIRAGVAYIRFLQGKWNFISNKEEQNKFVLASYNVGPGIIFAARRLAREEGRNPYVWSQVEPYVQSAVTRKYVHEVLKTRKKYGYTE